MFDRLYVLGTLRAKQIMRKIHLGTIGLKDIGGKIMRDTVIFLFCLQYKIKFNTNYYIFFAGHFIF